MSQTKEKIKQVGNTVLKVAKVAKILTIIGIISCAVAGSLFSVILISDRLPQIWEDHPGITEKITIHEEHAFGLIRIKTEVTDYDMEDLNDYMLDIAIECFIFVIMGILLVIVLDEVTKTFRMMAESDSPFNEQLLKRLKPIFILITVICAFEGIILALVVGAVLKCLYEIFKYGCELQMEADETL